MSNVYENVCKPLTHASNHSRMFPADAFSSQSEKELSCLRSRLDEVQGQMESKVDVIQTESDTLREQLKNAQDEKAQVMSEKEALLDEVGGRRY